jgi:hypothetical protein
VATENVDIAEAALHLIEVEIDPLPVAPVSAGSNIYHP